MEIFTTILDRHLAFRHQSLESGGPVECGVCVAGLLLYLLQPCALQLRPRVTPTQSAARLGGVLVIQLHIQTVQTSRSSSTSYPLLESLADILDIAVSKVWIC